MINKILIFITYILSFFLVFVSLGLADEESDYFMVLMYESIIFNVIKLSKRYKLALNVGA
jgi:hypothetical protein